MARGLLGGEPHCGLTSPLTEMSGRFPHFNDEVESSADLGWTRKGRRTKAADMVISVEEDILTLPLKPFCAIKEALKTKSVLNIQDMDLYFECDQGCSQ